MAVAFIGLGSMGLPLARLIAASELGLAVYDPVPQAREALAGKARLAASAADAAAGADTVCICVRDDAQLRDVVASIGDGFAPGAILVIHSTVAIATLKALRDELAPRGVAIVDAPVSRTRMRDDERFVFTMIGGDAADVARILPLVESFSTGSAHVGPLGAGMATKIANNLVTWVQIVVATQAANLVGVHGVKPAMLRSVMTANGNLTPTMGAVLDGKAVETPDPARAAFSASQAGIGEKDLQLAIEAASRCGLETSLAAAAQGQVRAAMTEPARRLHQPATSAAPS